MDVHLLDAIWDNGVYADDILMSILDIMETNRINNHWN